MAKVLAERLIEKTQTCAVSDSFSHDSRHLMRYILYKVINKPGVAGTLINLDQLRTSNRVECRYLDVVLRASGFGPFFCGLIADIYSTIRSVIRVNGHMSTPINIMRSVRLKFPLSSLLYELALESLIRKLRIILRELGCGCNVYEYADDITVLVLRHKYSELVREALKEYNAMAGAKINSQLSIWRSKLIAVLKRLHREILVRQTG